MKKLLIVLVVFGMCVFGLSACVCGFVMFVPTRQETQAEYDKRMNQEYVLHQGRLYYNGKEMKKNASIWTTRDKAQRFKKEEADKTAGTLAVMIGTKDNPIVIEKID